MANDKVLLQRKGRQRNVSRRTLVSAIVCTTILAFACCNRVKTKQTQEQFQKPASFRETIFTSVTPTADGGAYAMGFDSGLWYLRGSQAVKVKFPSLPTETKDTFFMALEITPLVDGGAYAFSMIDKSFWHLRTDTAERVVEVPSLSSMPPVAPTSGFALYITERRKRLEAEQKLEERGSEP